MDFTVGRPRASQPTLTLFLALFVLGSPEAGDSILFSLLVCPPYQVEIFNFLIISGTQVYHFRPFVL